MRSKPLKVHRNVTGSTVHGWIAVLVGLFVLVLSLGAIGVGSGLVPLATDTSRMPLWIVALMGLVFTLAGGRFVVHGIAGLRRRARARRVGRARPDEPWMADHPWDPEGTEDDSGRRVRQTLVAAVGFNILVGPMIYAVDVAGSGKTLPKVLTAFLGLIGVGLILAFIYFSVRRMKYGASRLTFGSFPFFPGERVEVTFRPSADLRQFERISFTLRYVAEEIVRQGGNPKVAAHSLWEVTREVSAEALSSFESDGLPLEFEVPGEAHPTKLLAIPAKYWELVAEAKMPRVDYRASFLIPIYRRP